MCAGRSRGTWCASTSSREACGRRPGGVQRARPREAGTGGQPPPSGVVSATPASGTPHLPATSSPTQQIRQLVQCGGTMYAVGSFSSIKQGSETAHPQRPGQLQRYQPLHGHVLGSRGGGEHEYQRVRRGRDQLHRVQRRQLRGRLHRRRTSPRSTAPAVKNIAEISHQYRQRGDRVRAQRQRRGGYPGRCSGATCWWGAPSRPSTGPASRAWSA